MQKRKRRLLVFALISFVLTYSCCSFSYSYYIDPGQYLSEFGRFETAEEVVAFLHEPFDLEVTTSEEIRAFMAAYDDACQDVVPTRGHFANYEIDENVANIIRCFVPARKTFPCNISYLIAFYISVDDKLAYIGVMQSRNCL